MEEVAFVTCRALPEMHDDDRRAADVLRGAGLTVVSAVWDDATVDWTRFACVLAQGRRPLLYARIDGIERDGQFVLMELEINEPYLYLGSSFEAANRFADAIGKAMEH